MSRGDGKSLGKAVQDGLVTYTSVSAIEKFDESAVGGCERRWYFRYVEGKPEPTTRSQATGTKLHAELEHYLKTGENVLSAISLAGKHLLPAVGGDLVIEASFGDITKAIELRKKDPQRQVPADHPLWSVAGLVAAGVPMTGFIDLRHGRGEFVDGAGVVRKERADLGQVVEVIDHKTTSSIQKYAKSPSALLESTQMVGYARYVVAAVPGVKHIRLSHIYYQTDGPKISDKRTVLLSAQEAVDRWAKVEAKVARMGEVARASTVEEVKPNLDACSAYGGCPHRAYCPKAPTQVSRNLLSRGDSPTQTSKGGPSMSLLDRLKKPTPVHQVTVTHAAPVTNGTNGHAQAERLAQIEAEKRRLMEEDAQPAKPVSAAVINPPDAPKPSLVEAADPIPAEVALGIADKALREKVETHAKAHVEVEAAKTETTVTAKKSEGGGRCPEGGKRIVLSPDQLVGREVRCGCGKSIKVKPDKDADGRWGVSLPGHNMPKVEQAEVASVPKPAAAPAATVDVFEQVSATDDEPVRPIEQGAAPAGITIFVNVVVEGAMGGCSLESYYAPLVKEIEQKYGAAELRVGPKDSPLAFGGWKGVLAAVVRENQPAPGAYTIFAPGEVAEVVIDALRSTATIYRGVR